MHAGAVVNMEAPSWMGDACLFQDEARHEVCPSRRLSVLRQRTALARTHVELLTVHRATVRQGVARVRVMGPEGRRAGM